jgi:Sec-independent protein translocase protein TatA
VSALLVLAVAFIVFGSASVAMHLRNVQRCERRARAQRAALRNEASQIRREISDVERETLRAMTDAVLRQR